MRTDTDPPRIIISTGEPAGIGPDITIQIAQKYIPADIVAIGDPDLLQNRASRLGLPLSLTEFDEDSKQNVITVLLKYSDGVPAINGLKRISKPGLRIYKKSDELPRVLNGLGTAVISTSKGLLTEKEARRQDTGGEVVCYIW